MKEVEKFYFLSIDDTFCVKLSDLSIDELEEVDYNLIEAIPDNNNAEYIYCTHFEEVIEKSVCKESICSDYSSKSGRGKCKHKGNLYQYGNLINVKDKL